MTEITIWVLADENGNAVSSHDETKLAELYDDEIGDSAEVGRRRVKVTINIPLPEPVEVVGEVSEEQGLEAA